MARYSATAWQGKRLFVGIDLHRRQWHVTIRTEDGLVLFRNGIAGHWPALQQVLEPYRTAAHIASAYEAGYFGFHVHDQLVAYGVDSLVTPPNLIPTAVGNKVKTDRLDSNRLAELLQAGLLKRVHVPTPEERAHREVARRRRQLLEDRVRTQNRIKAQLRLSSIEVDHEPTGAWSARFLRELDALQLGDAYQQHSFQVLLEQYHFLATQIDALTEQLRGLAEHDKYRDRVALLTTIPGLGWLSAIEILLELQDVARFRRAGPLAAYVGLTPAQYSSGEQVRMGRITRQGKPTLRMLLIQVAWRLIAKDPAMRTKYEELRGRAGGKRAIVAIARILLGRIRHVLLAQEPYAVGLVSG